MYEADVNDKEESINALPGEALRRFSSLKGSIVSRTVMPWGEHCTECVWPSCYTTCDLYAPRKDAMCRLFLDGMVRLDFPEGINPYLIKIRFKQWGKFWTVGNLHLIPSRSSDRHEKRNILIGKLIRRFPAPKPVKSFFMHKRHAFKNRMTRRPYSIQELPDFFLFQCYNPNQMTYRLSFTIRPDEGRHFFPFEKLLECPPGYTEEKIPFAEMAPVIGNEKTFKIDITPNDIPESAPLYFGCMDFVKIRGSRGPEKKAAKICKCVIWDLDNTVWDGVLVEDGINALRLKDDITSVIKTLDQRGIMNSIASKNNAEDAFAVLKKFQLDEYFLYPQISWEPKSSGVKHIAQSLNIGMDSLIFIDDQVFEREEVKNTGPEVTVLDAIEYKGLLDRPECNLPVTPESSQRRHMYQQQQKRDIEKEKFKDNYIEFLRNCKIKLAICSLDDSNRERVYELAQRTNQMNFSGKRYEKSELLDIQKNADLDTYVMRCEDKFGSYGIIGFAVINKKEPRLLDLMFSCRIQSKRIEHAFFTQVLQKYLSVNSISCFYANIRKTTRNASHCKVFDDIGFTTAGEANGVTSLEFPKSHSILNDNIIEIESNSPS